MKNNNLKAKMNNQNNNVKGSPFTHVDPNKVLDIKNVIPDLTKINNPAPVINNQPACRCAAYEAGKLYFNDIRNNIKDYDPKLNMDYIGIGIDDHPEYPGNPEYFKVTLTTKSDGEIITDFNVKTTNGSDWSTTINNLAKIIADIVKSFQSEDLNVDDSALTLQKTMQDKLNQALLSSKLKMTSENKEEETKPEQINYPVLVEEVTDRSNIIKCSINKDNNTGNKHKKKEQTEPEKIIYYPDCITNIIDKSDECPELDKAKEEFNKQNGEKLNQVLSNINKDKDDHNQKDTRFNFSDTDSLGDTINNNIADNIKLFDNIISDDIKSEIKNVFNNDGFINIISKRIRNY